MRWQRRANTARTSSLVCTCPDRADNLRADAAADERLRIYLQQNLTLVLFWGCLCRRRWLTWASRCADGYPAGGKRAPEEQQAVLAARRRLLRNLDHELRTPLTTIGLIAERLKQSEGSTAEREEAYDDRPTLQQILAHANAHHEGLRFLVEQDESHLERPA